MARRLGVVVVAGLLMMLSVVGVAAAAPPFGPPDGASGPPGGGCPASAGWEEVTPTPGHLSAAYDFNDDDRVCVRSLSHDTAITFMDNVVR
jgi:hypothetical protein